MGQPEMDVLRKHLHLRHGGQLRVTFEDPYLLPMFECVSCAEKMTWEPTRGWWNCPDCGYELTPDEARDIVQKLTAALKLLKTDVRLKRRRTGLGLWLLEKLFGPPKQLPP
jgi:transcription initiation factor IIE alpha subunit